MKILLASAIALLPTTAWSQVAAPSASPIAPAPTPAFDIKVAKAATAKLADVLERDYVFPEIGIAYAKALRTKLAAGGYDGYGDARSFADAVTADIQTINSDGHLSLRPPTNQPPAQPASSGQAQAGAIGPRIPPGIQKASWIAPGIAYVSFNMFPGGPDSVAALRAFLDDHATATTLIIDARVHRGGGLEEMDILFPRIFAAPTVLVHMDTRASVERAGRGPLGDGPNLRRVAGPDDIVRREHSVTPSAEADALRTAKIYLLTSGRTGSAAEHLALALKRTGRATLIGEVTAGAGNFGDNADLGGGYQAFVPVGRTFDPVTNQGWEGTGVAPDIAVPAEEALVEALTRSGIAPADAAKLSTDYRPEGSMQRRTPRKT